MPAPLAAHTRLGRDFAEEHGLGALRSRTLDCTEPDLWAFAALAARLGEAQRAYRGPAGRTLVMMTFGTVELSGI